MIAVHVKKKYAFIRAASDISENRFFRSLPDALWMKRERCWRIPRETISHILILEQEERMQVDWTSSDGDLELLKTSTSQLYQDALQAYRDNPFDVPDEYMNLLPVTGWFYWDDELDRLLVRGASDSSFRLLLKSFGGGRWIGERRSYTVEPSSVRALLQKLRKKESSFAVAQSAARRLQRFSTLKERIHELTSEELLTSPLRPAIVMADGSCVLLGTDTLLREALFPDKESEQERQEDAKNLTLPEVLRIIFKLPSRKEQVWLSSDVIAEIQKELKPGVHFFIYEWGTFLCASTSAEALRELVSLGTPEIIEHTIGGEPIYMMNVGEEIGEQLNLEEIFDLRLPAFHLHGAAEERLLVLSARARVRERTARMATPTYTPSEKVLDHTPELREKLYPHQRTAVEWFMEIGHGLLGDDMGLGKTISVLASFSELRWRGDVEKMVIVCPNSLVKNWLKEAKMWLPNLRFETPPKGATFRRSFFRKLQSYDYCDAVVVNFESFRSPQVLTPLLEWVQSHETFLCVDESQRAKNPQSKSFEALRKIAPHARRRILLSGTPAPRDISDLWTQIFLIDLGERFGGDFFRWLENIALLGNRYSKMAVLEFKEREVERVKLRVREVLLRRRKEQVVNLPEKIFSTRYIEMSGSQKRRYDEVCTSLRVRMTSMNGKAFYRDIDNTLEEFLRAVQIASNPRLVDETYSDIPAKFHELDQLLEELVEEQEEKVVVWTNYLGNVRELVKRYAKYGARAFSGEQGVHERDDAVEHFQDKRSACRVLIAVPAAGGVGITLTAAKTAIYIDKTWNGEHWLQSIDRVHRIGQEGVVHIVSLESGRVDALISSNLDRKELFLRELLDGEASRDELYPSREELLAALAENE